MSPGPVDVSSRLSPYRPVFEPVSLVRCEIANFSLKGGTNAVELWLAPLQFSLSMDSFKDVSPLHDPFTALKAGASKRRGQETSFAMRSLLFSTYRFSMSSEHAGISAQDACDFLQDGPTFLYANPSVLSVEADPVEAGLFQGKRPCIGWI